MNLGAYVKESETSKAPAHASSLSFPRFQRTKKTYGKLVCDHKLNKAKEERVRLTVGGDRLYYTGEVETSTALINSTLSTKDFEMTMMDIKNYYLGTPLPIYEYMRLTLSIISDEIITKYNLRSISVGGWVYLEMRKGMYGLKQSGLLANQLLQQILAHYSYYPARHTPGLWLHKTRSIAFTLDEDDFAVKYVGEYNARHLSNALLRHYEIATDWGGTVYSGITLKWDYQQRTRDILIHGCVTNVLKNSSTTYQNIHTTHHPSMTCQSMAPKYSTPPGMKHHSFPPSNALTSKRSQDQF
jgi:hypothetical protein